MSACRIYADHNAQTPLRPEARAAVERVLSSFGNPSSVHAEGRRAKAALDDARESVAASVGARSADLIFTSGAAEANNLAIAGGVKATQAGAIFVSQLEHDSVWRAAQQVGVPIVDVPVTGVGAIDCRWLADRLARWDASRDGRPFGCLMLANNETGIVQPVSEAAHLFHRAGGYLLCDAVQALGRMTIDIENLGADYLSLSAHKVGGLAGSGALLVRGSTPLAPHIYGGGQERSRRAGTENLAGAVAFGAVCAALSANETTGVSAVRDAFEGALRVQVPNALIIGANAGRIGNTSCVVTAGMAADMIIMAMDLAGIACSAGAACSSGKLQPSRTLTAMGLTDADVKSAVRFSFGWSNNMSDGTAIAEAYGAIVRRAREQRAA